MGILEQFKNQINIMNIMYDKIKILSKTSPLLLCQNLGDKEHKAEIMFMDINTNEIRVLDKSIVDIINKNTFIAYINEDYIFKVINKNNGETMLEEEYINGMSSYVINPNKDSYEILTASKEDNINSLTVIVSNKKPKILFSKYNLDIHSFLNGNSNTHEIVLTEKSIKASYDKNIELQQMYIIDDKGNIRVKEYEYEYEYEFR